MQISRRQFLRACMYTAPIALIVPEVARTLVLPPVGGWRPLTVQEIIQRALRARAGRLAENIIQNNLLFRRLTVGGLPYLGRHYNGYDQLEIRSRVRNIGEAFEGHLLDIARDETAIARYLTAGTSLHIGELVMKVPNEYTGYPAMATVPVPPAIPMPEEFRVEGKIVQELSIGPTPDEYLRLNVGRNA